MTDINVTLIFPASKREQVDAIMPGINTGLSASGSLPATHYVTSGWIPADLAAKLEPLASTVGEGDGIAVISGAGLQLCAPAD